MVSRATGRAPIGLDGAPDPALPRGQGRTRAGQRSPARLAGQKGERIEGRRVEDGRWIGPCEGHLTIMPSRTLEAALRTNVCGVSLASVVVTLAACSAPSAPPSEGADEDEIRSVRYELPRLECTNAGAASRAAGEITYVNTTTMGGMSFLDFGQWQALDGFPQPLEANMSEPVSSVGRTSRFTISGESMKLVVEDAADGALVGKVTYQGKTTVLTCAPRALFCASPSAKEGEPVIQELVLARMRKTEDLREVDAGIGLPELTLVTGPANMPQLRGEVTVAFAIDPKGVLEASKASVTDPQVGTVEMAWDPAAKRRTVKLVATSYFASRFHVPEGGFPAAVCELARPASSPPPSQ